MPIDITLVRMIISVLGGARTPMTEYEIAVEIETRLRKNIMLHLLRSALSLCASKGWIRNTQDDFTQDLWQLTTSGKKMDMNFFE